MPDKSVEDTIEAVLRQHCRIELPPDAGPHTRLAEDLGLDSIGLLTLALELENHYRFKLEEDPDHPPTTLGELADLLKERLHA